jgi:hypothetical protein
LHLQSTIEKQDRGNIATPPVSPDGTSEEQISRRKEGTCTGGETKILKRHEKRLVSVEKGFVAFCDESLK